MPAATRAAIDAAWRSRDPREEVRARHLRADGSPKYTNRLVLESSPYLRQHSHNPVDWYPWGDEAFEAARRLGRPVLLSIGYSTCHWCHVMEEESFEDEEIARYLNEHYVAIKVDREQRPDLDGIYMAAVEAASGRGGWPMTVWLTPGREPFFGGTYFPPRDGERGAGPGFLTMLTRLADAYAKDAGAAASRASTLADQVRRMLSASASPGEADDPRALESRAMAAALAASKAAFDPVHGGTRGAPKFPGSLPLRALLRLDRRGADADARSIVTTTLEGMAAGGIRDQLDGGFHRYSTDAEWIVPHFEKMLYDNALLAVAFTEAWQVTKQPVFREAAEGILAWAITTMRVARGGFASATDADSRGPDGRLEEGRYYTWTPDETRAALGDDAPAFDRAFGVVAAGPVDGRSVLHVVAAAPAPSRAWLDSSRARLLDARRRRPAPLRDDKVLTAWNGLMISALSRAALAFGEDRWREAACEAADFVLSLRDGDGRLAHGLASGRVQAGAFLDDYAFLEAGLLDLHEAGGDETRLGQAIALDRILERDFEDPAGGFFVAPPGQGDLLVRERSLLDGAEPSGASVEMLNLGRLAEWTGDASYRDRASRALARVGAAVEGSPLSFGEALVALDFAGDTAKEIVLASDGPRATLAPFLAALGAGFVPNRVLVTVTAGSSPTIAASLAQDKVAKDGRPTAYVCENRVCRLPTTDPAIFAAEVRAASTIEAGPTPR